MEKRSQPRSSSLSSEESLLAFSTTFFPNIKNATEETPQLKPTVPTQPEKSEKSEKSDILLSEAGWVPLTPQSGLELRSWDESWWTRYSKGISTVAFWVFAIGMIGYGILLLLSMRGSGSDDVGGSWVFRGEVDGMGGLRAGNAPSTTSVGFTSTMAAMATAGKRFVERKI